MWEEIMSENQRYELYCELIRDLDTGCGLIMEYDSLLHDYKGTTLYQAEAQILKMVGQQPGISAAECARTLNKTLSACSQLIKKLRAKEWILQKRNESNNRVYNLYLTESGRELFLKHQEFESCCYERTYHLLDSFTEEELQIYRKVQQKLNEGFMLDVKDSREFNNDLSLRAKKTSPAGEKKKTAHS